MGRLVDGQWTTDDFVPRSRDGRFVRAESRFRSWITPDGSAGPTGESGFAAESGRYHLYISHACPWAHRTHIFLKLKGLEEMVTLSVVHWFMAESGWTFEPGDGVVADGVNQADALYQVYQAADPNVTGRVTVPVLWDKARGTIVNNESSEIIRMFGSAFDGIGARPGDFYPEALRAEIDSVNERVYETVNNGVYKCGFARSQDAYDDAAVALFETLDWLEARLDDGPWLVGDGPTEADWRLFTTLVRFDAVYHGHFKCNRRRLIDYPNLWGHTKRLYAVPGVSDTVVMDHITKHYYSSHTSINPSGIVPVGPETLFE